MILIFLTRWSELTFVLYHFYLPFGHFSHQREISLPRTNRINPILSRQLTSFPSHLILEHLVSPLCGPASPTEHLFMMWLWGRGKLSPAVTFQKGSKEKSQQGLVIARKILQVIPSSLLIFELVSEDRRITFTVSTGPETQDLHQHRIEGSRTLCYIMLVPTFTHVCTHIIYSSGRNPHQSLYWCKKKRGYQVDAVRRWEHAVWLIPFPDLADGLGGSRWWSVSETVRIITPKARARVS